MKFKISLFFISVFFISLLQSQTIYLNENGEEIDSISYNVKCNRSQFFCKKYKEKDKSFFKVFQTYSFGKISGDLISEIRTHYKIPEKEFLIIHFRESIANFSNELSNYEYNFRYFDTISIKQFNRKQFDNNFTKWESRILNDSKKLLKQNDLNILHVLKNYNIKHSSRINWNYTNRIFNELFEYLRNRVGVLVIKNNGEIFISRERPEIKLISKILTKDWEGLKTKLEEFNENTNNLEMVVPFINGYGKRKRYFDL